MESPNAVGLVERKYQVFISSTFQDLQEERNKVLEVIVDRGHIPIALERFSAADQSVRKIIEKTIKQCQIYVVILGHRYGARERKGGRSFTHIEYEYAIREGLTVLPFVLSESEFSERRADLRRSIDERKQQEATLTDDEKRRLERDSEELKSEAQLVEFHTAVQKSRFCRPFDPKDERFHYLVGRALEDAEASTDMPGWVQEPEEPAMRGIFRSVSSNPFIVEVVDELSRLDALDQRCLDQREKKQALADTFVDLYQDAVLGQSVNVFLESGSTIAYVGQKLGPHVKQALKGREVEERQGQYSTNNVLAFLQLWLIHRVPCSLFPWGPPELTYGASFGFLEEEFWKEPEPRYPPEPLNRKAKESICRLSDLAFSIAQWEGLSLFLGAVSGLQLSDSITMTGRSYDSDFPEACRGPHVGSWRNKLFKRFMYDTGQPTMIFLTDDKIDCPIDIGKCHFILDEELAWQSFRSSHPLAFCVGCDTQDIVASQRPFQKAGFRVVMGRDYGDQSAFVARNDVFIEQFETKAGLMLKK